MICFALLPDHPQNNLLKPLSFSLLAQITKIFDEQPVAMSEKISKYRDMLLKNRARTTVALRSAVRSVGVFLLHENVTHAELVMFWGFHSDLIMSQSAFGYIAGFIAN